MSADITLKRNDAGRTLTGQFTDANGVVPCTGNTARKILMRKIGASALKIDSTFTFTNEAEGRWAYTLLTTDVDTAGTYSLEFEVTFPTEKVTFPTGEKTYYEVLIKKDLG